MKLSPLRKQVEQLNKDLQSQNIQIKDLINFLSKSTPKTNSVRPHSPRSQLKRVLRMKDSYTQTKIQKETAQKKSISNKLMQNKSVKYIKPFHPVKNNHEQIFKSYIQKQVPLTKSVTFHNIQNALTTRKYLKLSRPDKKVNASCSFCRQATIASVSSIRQQQTDRVNFNENMTKTQKKQSQSKCKQNKEECIKQKSLSKRNENLKSKTKLTQNQSSVKKTPLKQMSTNQILSKNQVKSFIYKKSLASCNKVKNNKIKLELKEQKSYTGERKFLTKR